MWNSLPPKIIELLKFFMDKFPDPYTNADTPKSDEGYILK